MTGEIGTKNSFGFKNKVSLVIALFRTKLALVVANEEGVPYVMFEPSSCKLRHEKEEKLFRLQE
jgi:hypothetical protein